jgi:hypothetical protein
MIHQQFCGSGLRNRSNVTSAASAAQVPASSAQANPVKNVVDCLDTVIAVSTDHHWLWGGQRRHQGVYAVFDGLWLRAYASRSPRIRNADVGTSRRDFAHPTIFSTRLTPP